MRIKIQIDMFIRYIVNISLSLSGQQWRSELNIDRGICSCKQFGDSLQLIVAWPLVGRLDRWKGNSEKRDFGPLRNTQPVKAIEN